MPYPLLGEMSMFRSLLVPSLALIPVLAAFFGVAHWYPDLLSGNHSTAFSTIGTFVTVYATVVALVEIIRARGIAQQIFGEAEKVSGVIADFHMIQEVVECQEFLGTAICALEDEVAIPPTALNGIIKVYSKTFRDQLADGESLHSECRARLYAYKSSAKDKLLRQNTLVALRTILGHLSELAGQRSSAVKDQLIGEKPV
ncbi:hypothetical protein [Rhodanobacter spathiphylli]|uniref:hypothetical protein n=1 Tax=Rhodanobacter spathiphylli TaxID=347483 RepID=UPI0012FBEC17|nr:hypothetical protein [Rhodanobacter spathiphylli]